MFYLTTHSTNFILRLYGIGDLAIDANGDNNYNNNFKIIIIIIITLFIKPNKKTKNLNKQY